MKYCGSSNTKDLTNEKSFSTKKRCPWNHQPTLSNLNNVHFEGQTVLNCVNKGRRSGISVNLLPQDLKVPSSNWIKNLLN